MSAWLDHPQANMQWFGRRYDAPAWEAMTEAETPVGLRCSHCTELVAEGDAGIVMGHWHAVGMTVEPIHVECWLRSIIGSVEHLEGRCSCFGGAEEWEGDLSWREQGRRTMAWLERRRGKQMN